MYCPASSILFTAVRLLAGPIPPLRTICNRGQKRSTGSARLGGSGRPVVLLTGLSGRTMARTGLRMMPTSPSPPLKSRTAGFPQYGLKASISDRTCLNDRSVKPTPGIPGQSLSLSPSFAHFGCRKVPGSVPRTTGSSMCRCSKGFRLSTPGVLGSGSSYVVSIRHGLVRPHAPVPQARCDFASRLYAAPSLCGSA